MILLTFIDDTETIFFPKDDQSVQESFDELQAKFSHIMTEIKLTFRKKATNVDELSTKISDWVEHQLNLKHGTVDNDLDNIFKKIYHNYDFIDCSLIVAMCNEFISEEKDLLDELKVYSLNANAFRSSEPIIKLKQKLRKVYGPYRRNLENMPLICIELQNPWNEVKINGLYILVSRLLPKKLRQSLMKCITIEEGSVIIKLHILDITADSLIEYTGGKLQFMRLIGIFSLYINDHPVLQEDENTNFTFELALLEAVTAGNNEAVEFLLQLETININSNEAKTALMLACERGHEDIVHSLLSAGANVNIQDNKGWNALMRASKHNHISLIHMLLQANANLHLKTSDGSNALMIASCYGNCEIVELLISKGVDYKYQREDGVNAFMVACHSGHIQIVEMLLKEQVDPNVQSNNGVNAFMLACINGHTQIAELLLKEQVDPNVQNKSGWNAFMFACVKGQFQIVKLLLKEKINPNAQDKNNWNAFMLACVKGDTKIIELLLLKEHVDPNVQNNDGVNAFMLACENGDSQIVELLLQEQIDPNVQSKKGVTALMIASVNGCYEAVKVLLEWKADPTIKCNNGHTALQFAMFARNIEIFVLLNTYLREHCIEDDDDAASILSFETVTSGYHDTILDIGSMRSYLSNISLDLLSDDSCAA